MYAIHVVNSRAIWNYFWCSVSPVTISAWRGAGLAKASCSSSFFSPSSSSSSSLKPPFAASSTQPSQYCLPPSTLFSVFFHGCVYFPHLEDPNFEIYLLLIFSVVNHWITGSGPNCQIYALLKLANVCKVSLNLDAWEKSHFLLKTKMYFYFADGWSKILQKGFVLLHCSAAAALTRLKI